MVFLTGILLILLYLTRRNKGGFWIFLLPWTICILPVSLGLVKYNFFSLWDFRFIFILALYILIPICGVWIYNFFYVKASKKRLNVEVMLIAANRWIWVAWGAGLIGTFCVLVDFYFCKDAGLDELVKIRDIVVRAESVSWYARFGSVLTWGCLYSFIFALYFREFLTRWKFLIFLLPIFGYFLTSLLIAGRQASFQILIITILVELIKPTTSGKKLLNSKYRWVFFGVIISSMIGYMSYIAVCRTDLLSRDQSIVIQGIFDFSLTPYLSNLMGKLNDSVSLVLIEATIYLTSPIPLFSKFIDLQFPKLYMGAMSFPFLLRQLEPVTGINVMGALQTKIELMKSTGVVGVGWTTAISSYIMDLGREGAAVILFFQGFYTAYSWNSICVKDDFNSVVILLILFMIAIYMPLSAATGETSLFLLWLFCMGAQILSRRRIATL